MPDVTSQMKMVFAIMDDGRIRMRLSESLYDLVTAAQVIERRGSEVILEAPTVPEAYGARALYGDPPPDGLCEVCTSAELEGDGDGEGNGEDDS